MTETSFAVARADSSVLVHVPHAGVVIPSAVRAAIVLSDSELATELQVMTDWHTDRLARAATESSTGTATIFANGLSRLVVDPERFPDDREVMRSVGMGAVYTHTSQRTPLRRLDGAIEAELLEQYFFPYADALADEVDRILNLHGVCTIIDLHSYPSSPLPYELDQSAERPSICIGTDDHHTPASLRSLATMAFESVTADVAFNTPFAGTYVPTRHYTVDQRVRSVMVEIRRDIYLEEPSEYIDDPAARIVSALARLIESIARE
jgi:N-formylglutamate amidohydrolase